MNGSIENLLPNETPSLNIEIPMFEDNITQSPTMASSEAVIDCQSDSSNDDRNQQDELKSAIAELATLSPLDYDLKRKEIAKKFGVQVKTLDAEVKASRTDVTETQSIMFPKTEPSAEAVNPEQLFNDIESTIKLFIVLTSCQALAITLWIVMTWVIHVLKVAPSAIFNAPEKACGKSQVLDITGFLSNKALSSSNITTAGLFRVTEQYCPTLLIDEVDTFIRDNNDLKGLINAGHTRNSAYVIRIVGENNEPKRFNVFGAKALAGISLEKHLPDSTMSRGIIFNMRRKLPHEVTQRLRHADMSVFDVLKSKLARFALDYEAQIKASRPVMPDELSDRAQDNWEPLLAIAGCAGSDYLQRATEAALALSVVSESSVSIGTELLMDIQVIFEKTKVEKISTSDLIEDLIQDVERPWATYNRGKSISPRQIAQLLSKYGIHSKTVRISQGNTPKGFDLGQFLDVFARYLSTETFLPPQRNDSAQATPVMVSGVAAQTQHDEPRCVNETVADEAQQNATLTATPEASPTMTCGAVADVAANSEPDYGDF